MACESATVRRAALHNSRRVPFTQLFRPRDVFHPSPKRPRPAGYLGHLAASARRVAIAKPCPPAARPVPRPSLTAAARWVLAASHSASHAAQKLPMPFSPSVLGKPAGSDRNHA
jgi:hypothetical protein